MNKKCGSRRLQPAKKKAVDISGFNMDKSSKGLLRIYFSRLLENKISVIGGIFIIFLFIIAIFAPVLSPYDPGEIDTKNILAAPSWKHPFGTDQLGRDVLSRMIWGSRISLMVGFVAVGIATVIGVALGSISGYYRGKIDNVIMRFVDMMLAIPTFFLLLAAIAFLEPSIWTIMAVIGLTGWMGVTRLVRAEFISLKEREFVLAVKAEGARDLRIIFRHILPNAIAPVLVSATLGVAGAILTESALSFLGLGVQPPIPSWGNILTGGKDTIEIAWWLTLYPGFAILVTVLGYNLLGEGIRDALDPRLH